MISSSTKDKIVSMLGENGRRLTTQKRLVLKILFEHNKEHLTVEKLYEYAKKESSHISIATVYKTVSVLEDENILRKIRIDDKCSCYELVDPDKPDEHPHCICRKCGKTIGIMDNSIIRMLNTCEQSIKERYHFQIDMQDILYYGLCEECSKSIKTEKNK